MVLEKSCDPLALNLDHTRLPLGQRRHVERRLRIRIYTEQTGVLDVHQAVSCGFQYLGGDAAPVQAGPPPHCHLL